MAKTKRSRPPRTRTKKPPAWQPIPVRSSILGTSEPEAPKERATRIERQSKEWFHRTLDSLWFTALGRQEMLDRLIQECRHDPRFLDKALMQLKPLRRAGRTKRPTYVAESIVQALKGYRRKDIVEAIAKTENVSESQAQRLYDAVRKPRK